MLNFSSKHLQVFDSHCGIREEALSNAYLDAGLLHTLLQIIQSLQRERERGETAGVMFVESGGQTGRAHMKRSRSERKRRTKGGHEMNGQSAHQMKK